MSPGDLEYPVSTRCFVVAVLRLPPWRDVLSDTYPEEYGPIVVSVDGRDTREEDDDVYYVHEVVGLGVLVRPTPTTPEPPIPERGVGTECPTRS